jgi:DNA-binding transcriptional ArsR family regulator
MDQKTKESPKTKEILRQLQVDMRQLQDLVHARAAAGTEGDPASLKPLKSDWAVQLAIRSSGEEEKTKKAAPLLATFTQLAQVDTEDVAVLGNAVSSPQKVALLRVLMAKAEGESAAFLGETAGLSTGSLYHHLHDLTHAGLIRQGGRNCYLLTEQGRRVLLTLLALTTFSQGS